jgi:ABC-type bacteriocin/lantibiotic exporter with double-glycine peptidase domain
MSIKKAEYILRNLLRLWRHFRPRRRVQVFFMMVLIIFGAIAELATLGSVLPFLYLLSNPLGATKYEFINSLNSFFNNFFSIKSDEPLLLAIIFFGFILTLSSVLRVIMYWVNFRFVYKIGVDIGYKVFQKSLNKPYEYHVSHNTSETIVLVNSVQDIILSVITPVFHMLASFATFILIFSGLLYIDYKIAICTGFVFCSLYMIISYLAHSKLLINSNIIFENEKLKMRTVQEGLGGVRDVIINGTENVYINKFNMLDVAQRKSQASNAFIGTLPRSLVESIGMFFIAFLAYYLSLNGDGMQAVIPIIGSLALGSQKIIPQMQQIYFAWVSLKGSSSSLEDVLNFLESPDDLNFRVSQSQLSLRRSIRVSNLSFQYATSKRNVLDKVNCEILCGERVGIVGATGCGKSSFVDLIMGLLRPVSGEILIDDTPLSLELVRDWQKTISHVPQTVYLSDASIAENIAFGINKEELDYSRVVWAASKAQISSYIDSLPSGYQTIVGERGIQLSGGQRQRIGIARALYKKAKVMILDEATSALDQITESAVMDAINNLEYKVTLIMIAHRISSLENCDRIVEIENGRIINDSSFKEYIKKINNAKKSTFLR